VPLILAPSVWKNLGFTGTGIRIGIIDTGLDYVHTNFGGTGTQADLDTARSAANNPLSPGDPFDPAFTVTGGSGQLYPSAKVAGGWDFAGDDYDAGSNPIPAPDPNPMDCPSSLGGGHGSHVAGTAGGFGVNADGTTFAGPWDDTVPFATMGIGPGAAPEAQLYALRVFGCNGSTALTAAAIDWAVDPNGDGDFSDRLDVINMSLGSAYGTPDSETAVAATNAAAAGVVVVASAGNSGDLYYVSGSPGSSTRTLTVASSVDDSDRVDGFRVEPVSGIAGDYPATRSVAYAWEGMTPVTAPLYYPATNQYGCSAWAGADLANISGRIVVVDWMKPGDATFPCGSVTRAANAVAAGAVGILMVENQPFFSTSITGSAVIPAMLTVSTAGDTLKTVLVAGTVSTLQGTMTNALAGSVWLTTPGLADTVSTFTSRGPQGVSNGLKPDISAPGQGIFSTDAGTGTKGVSLNGTSMAAPHMAGVMALLRQANPAWTVEELKALAMNYARHDLYTGLNQTGTKFAPARVGAGRVNAADSADGKVVAYVADEPGAVSVSFGALEVVGTMTFERTVTVANKGGVAAAYDLTTEARTAIDGVAVSTDVPSITVPAGGSTTFKLVLSANAALMKNTRDATVVATQNGSPRQFLSEASGLVVLTPTSGATLTARLPYYAAARPASQMTATPTELVFASDTGSSLSLTLAGTGVDTGLSPPLDYLSLVTPFELAHVSPEAALGPGVPTSARHADLKYVGVTATRTSAANPSRVNNSTIYFGVATHASWSTPASEVEFDVYIDTDRDGTEDFVLYSTRLTATDVFVAYLQPLGPGSVAAAFLNGFSANLPTAIFNTNVVVLPVAASALNMGASNTRFNYRVDTYSRFWGQVDATPWLTFDYAAPGLDFLAAGTGSPTAPDLPGVSLPVAFNGPAYRTNGSQGALLLHHFNAGTAAKTEVIPLGCPTITVTNPAVATGAAGVAFSQLFTQSGGLGTVTFSTASALPAGLTLAADGTLAGIPTEAGPFPITVTATDANGCTGSTNYTLTIVCPVITLAPATLPGGVSGTPYSQSISASGGAGGYSFAPTAGALPGGLTLSSAGLLSGTPTSGGTFNFTVGVTDGVGCPGSASYSLTIAGAPVVGSVTPAGGSASGGQTVTISGSGFLGATSVTFGGVPATIVSVTDTQIVVTTPPHAPGVVDVVVTTPGGSTTAAAAFAYDGMAVVPALSPWMLLVLAAALAGIGVLRLR
jgi:subtilisin family serine protease